MSRFQSHLSKISKAYPYRTKKTLYLLSTARLIKKKFAHTKKYLWWNWAKKYFLKNQDCQPAHSNDTEPEPVVIYKDCLKLT